MTNNEERLSQELNSWETEQEKTNREMWKYFQNMNNQFKLMSWITIMWMLKWMKWLATWTVEQTKIKWINSIIYFLALSWVLNIIYFLFFEVIEAYSYAWICILLPIALTIFIAWNWNNSLWRFFQKIFFNDKEITIIFISSLIVFLITLFI